MVSDLIYRLLPACTLSCEFCRVWQNPIHEQDYLPLADAIQDLKMLSSRPRALHLGGGDPLLYPHIEELLSAVRSWFTSVRVYTPGLTYLALAEKLRPHDCEICFVFNHPSEADNNRIGGEYHFNVLRGAVAKARSIGQAARLVLLAHCESALVLPEAEELARSWGVPLEIRPVHWYMAGGRLEGETLAYIKRYVRTPGVELWPAELRPREGDFPNTRCLGLPARPRGAWKKFSRLLMRRGLISA